MFPRKKRRNFEIYPDEIFLDSENISEFNRDQFEGRIEKPLGKFSFFSVGTFFAIIIFVFLFRAFFLQVVYGENYSIRSENNRLRSAIIMPNRGIIYDRNNEKLAWNGPGSRIYADLVGLSHTLGYVSWPVAEDLEKNKNILPDSIMGREAIEKKYNQFLLGVPGLKLIETDSQNNVVSESIQKVPESGRDLFLTIDSRVQSKFFEIMGSVIGERGFRGGAGVVLDVETGEVLALASYPEYSSQIISDGVDNDKIQGFIQGANNPFLNRVVSGLYTPGSVIKPLIAIAALNENIISPEKSIFSSGSISIPNPFFPDQFSVFNDWKAHGWVDMRQALAVSSNAYFWEIGGGLNGSEGLGISRIEKYAKLFGFGSETGIDLFSEQKGLVPNPEWKENNLVDPVWRIGDTYNTSIGQGFLQVTPMQIGVYVASLANNGKIIQPHLVFIDNNNSDNYNSIKRVIDIPQEYFEVAKEGMRRAVLEGTASALNIPSVSIAAKTGTAEIGKKYVNSWIIGFFPYENPKYAFTVALEHGPVENLIGGLYVMRQLFEWMTVNTPEYLSN